MYKFGLALTVAIVLCAGTAAAQSAAARTDSDAPLVETSVGYTDVRARTVPVQGCCFHMQGLTASADLPLNRWLSLASDFGFYHTGNVKSSGSSLSMYSFMFGPRVSYRKYQRFTPFAQWIFGVGHATGTLYATSFSVGTEPPKARTDFAMAAGAGLDVAINKNWSLRVPEVDWFYTKFPNGNSNSQDNLRITVGVVYRSWRARHEAPVANRAPVAGCSVDSSSVIAGSGATVRFSVMATDPDGDALTYVYSVTGGAIEGTGPEARWNSAGLAAGTYTTSVTVNDNRGGQTSCSTDLRVERPPNRPPTAVVSAERTQIQTGESTTVGCNGSDPDGDPLTYRYTVTGGQIIGTGNIVTFDSTGLSQGTYTVTCEANDGRGGIVSSAVNILVLQPPPPPQPQAVQQLEVRLALHSVYFPSALPAAQQPDGGLLASQQMTLDNLATDFKQYLMVRPDAHLMLTGHADLRGARNYNQALSERRVQRTKSYLVAQGVPADRIDTMAVGQVSNLSANDVRRLLQQDTDLSAADRQRLLANLQTIVLANNRRVDVTLSTTGEQSQRRFPFNAQDAAALLSRTSAGARR